MTMHASHLSPFLFGSLQVSSEAVVPARSLYAKPVRTVLLNHLIKPVMQSGWAVIGLRLGWPRDEESNEYAWLQIVRLRAELDEIARKLPDSLLIVSAITGVLVGQRKVYPGVGYWIVTRSKTTDCKAVLAHFSTNGATAKLLLQPYQNAEKDYAQVLFHLVKDNVAGCVPRHVQTSVRQVYGSETWEPVVKIYNQQPSLRPTLEKLTAELEALNFGIPVME